MGLNVDSGFEKMSNTRSVKCALKISNITFLQKTVFVFDCKSQCQNSVFQPCENFYFENFPPDPTMVGLNADSGFERMSNTRFVNCALKINNMTFLRKTVFAKANLKIVFSSLVRTFILKTSLRTQP